MPSLLDTQPTTDSNQKFSSYRAHTTRFDDGDDFRTRLFYEHVDSELSTGYTERYSSCRTNAWFMRNDESGRVRVQSNNCNLRWCPFCSKIKSYICSKGVTVWLRKAFFPKLLTITLKSGDTPLWDQINYIYDAFKKLRKRSAFKQKITGGIWFFQVTKSKKTNLWHPHIHCLCEGQYMPHRKLKSLWESITGDSYIVDIRAVKDYSKVVNDASRYISRPMSLLGLNTSEQMELFNSFRGRRLAGKFGTASKVSLRADSTTDTGTWSLIGSWSTVTESADYDPSARAILRAWHLNEPLSPEIHVMDTEDFLDNVQRPPPKAKFVDNQTTFCYNS